MVLPEPKLRRLAPCDKGSVEYEKTLFKIARPVARTRNATSHDKYQKWGRLMKEFKEIDPITVAKHPNLVETFTDITDVGNTFYFLLIDDFMIIADTKYFTYKSTGESKWLHYQIEFPKRGLKWILDTLESKFFKTEAEGGLPKGTFNYIGTVDGERLKLRRAFNADGNGGGGYAFITLDRKEPNSVCSKSYTFSDSLLFENGMIDIMKDIANKIDKGKF